MTYFTVVCQHSGNTVPDIPIGPSVVTNNSPEHFIPRLIRDRESYTTNGYTQNVASEVYNTLSPYHPSYIPVDWKDVYYVPCGSTVGQGFSINRGFILGFLGIVCNATENVQAVKFRFQAYNGTDNSQSAFYVDKTYANLAGSSHQCYLSAFYGNCVIENYGSWGYKGAYYGGPMYLPFGFKISVQTLPSNAAVFGTNTFYAIRGYSS